jgi:regulator of protease activity HflC (stomatin/prohibitin superfamily)
MKLLLIISAVLVVILLSGIRVAWEYQRGVHFRLGRYRGIKGPGLFWIIPLGIDRVVIVDSRTKTVSAEQQETITRDSVTIKLNAVLWYKIVDAPKSVIVVSEAASAVYQLALTGLRNIIGKHDLDEVLQERDKINELLKESIADSTTPWGIEVERFEMKDAKKGHASSRPKRSWKRRKSSRRRHPEWPEIRPRSNCAACR